MSPVFSSPHPVVVQAPIDLSSAVPGPVDYHTLRHNSPWKFTIQSALHLSGCRKSPDTKHRCVWRDPRAGLSQASIEVGGSLLREPFPTLWAEALPYGRALWCTALPERTSPFGTLKPGPQVAPLELVSQSPLCSGQGSLMQKEPETPGSLLTCLPPPNWLTECTHYVRRQPIQLMDTY